MASTYRIDVELLHQLDILLHPLPGDHISPIRVKFVPVDALDEYALAVDQQVCALDLDFAETNVETQRLQHALAVEQLDGELIEIRRLGTPLVRVVDIETSADKRTGSLDGIGHFLAVGIKQVHFHACPPVVGYRNVYLEGAVAVVLVQVGRQLYVFDVTDRTCVQIAVARNAREAEEILVLQIGSVAPAENLESDQVALPRQDVGREVELAAELAVFAVSHEFAVDPQIDAGCHGTEVDDDLFPFPVGRYLEGLAVAAHVIVFQRHHGRLALETAQPGIADVHIYRIAVSVQFPETRQGHPAPACLHVFGIPEAHGALVGAAHPAEAPVSRKRDDPGLFGQEGAVHRKTVDGIDQGVLPLGEILGLAAGGAQQEQETEKERFYSHRCFLYIQI